MLNNISDIKANIPLKKYLSKKISFLFVVNFIVLVFKLVVCRTLIYDLLYHRKFLITYEDRMLKFFFIIIIYNFLQKNLQSIFANLDVLSIIHHRKNNKPIIESKIMALNFNLMRIALDWVLFLLIVLMILT